MRGGTSLLLYYPFFFSQDFTPKHAILTVVLKYFKLGCQKVMGYIVFSFRRAVEECSKLQRHGFFFTSKNKFFKCFRTQKKDRGLALEQTQLWEGYWGKKWENGL